MGEMVIIGAGISGLMASHKFSQAVVLERGTKNSIMPMINATFYAHERVPKFAEQEVLVRTFVRGSGDSCDYAEKIYGDRNHPVSMSDIQSEVKAWKWDSQALLSEVSGRVLWECEVTGIDMDEKKISIKTKKVGSGFLYYDQLICSLPLPVMLAMLRWRYHDPFISEPIWLSDVVSEDVPPIGEQHVIYYPDLTVPYYRSNQMGGSEIIELEYSENKVPDFVRQASRALRPGKIWPHPRATQFVEQLRKNSIIMIGRYACWVPKMLSHHTWQFIQSLEE